MKTQPPVSYATGKYNGIPGDLTRYFWVQVIYPSGRSVLSNLVTIPRAGSLGSGNQINISWGQAPGASGYDVIETPSATEPNVGDSGNWGVSLGVTAQNVTLNYEQTLQSWTYEQENGSVSSPPGSPVNSVQFNLAGAFAGDSNLLWDNTDKLLKIGGSPITPFAGLYVGPDESTLDSFLQGFYNAPTSLFTVKSSAPGLQVALGIEAQDGPGIYSATLNINGGGGPNQISEAGTFESYVGKAGVTVGALDTFTSANGFAADYLIGIHIFGNALDGGSANNNLGLFIDDQTGATNNWAIKTGLGLVAIQGDPLTMFTGLYVGPDESTLPALLQGYTGGQIRTSVLPSGTLDTGGVGLGIEAYGNGVGVFVGTISSPTYTTSTSFGFESDAYAGVAGASILGYYSFGSANGLAAALYRGFYVQSPDVSNGGSFVTTQAFWAEDQTGATNAYYSWFDSQGVRRVKEDASFNSVGQAIEALYNPQFPKYTPGATDYERIILDQWNSNVAEIGNQAGGSGTLRDLRLIGAHIRLGADPMFESGNHTGSGTALLGTNSPSAHLSAPYTWIDVLAADGTLCTMPIWQK